MKANDIYKLPVKRESRDLYPLRYMEAFPNIKDDDLSSLTSGINYHVVIKTVEDCSSDGERSWFLFTVWLDKKPFMIGQRAGRGGCDYYEYFITDEATYREADDYLKSLIKREDTLYNVIDPDEDRDDLDTFYGYSLEEIQAGGVEF